MRCLIVSASMGAGHNGAARELAGRLSSAGHEAEVVDLVELLPYRTGALLRGFYSWMLRYTPWLYELVYRLFFIPRRVQPTASPVVRLALPALRRAVGEFQPDTVVSTFHLSAQAVGELRRRGELPASAAVMLVDFAVHQLWLHPGNDLYLCTHPTAARTVRTALKCNVRSSGPIVPQHFQVNVEGASDDLLVRRRLGLPEHGRVVIVAGGSLGVGGGVRSAALALAASGRYVPVVLCGRNDRLRRHLAAHAGVVPLGWVDDMPALFTVSSVLIENGGGGLTCAEGFAAGLPVVSYRPIPGHGRAGAREMAAAGLATLARNDSELLAAVDSLSVPGRVRDTQVAAARALFTEDVAGAIAGLVTPQAETRPDSPVGTQPMAREACAVDEAG